MADQLKCPVCAKALGPNPCLTCDGSGSVKWVLFLHRVCPACAGEGTQVRCPDLESHVLAGPTAGQQPSIGNICPECKGAGFLRRFGGIGGGSRCPTCGGKGLITPKPLP